MTQTLAAFLLARLDEDEAFVNMGVRIGNSPALMSTGRKGVEGVGAILDVLKADPEAVELVTRCVSDGTGAPGESKRLLADFEAKRLIIRQHAGSDPDETGAHECPDGFMDSAETDPHTGFMRNCPTLRYLALPYEGHPDYREEWRP